MAAKKLPPLSPGETVILALLWKRGRATVQELHELMPPGREVAYATVQTLLRRLEKKGYVRHEQDGRAHVFIPAVHKSEVLRRSVKEFLQRFYGGDPMPLMLHLAQTRQITAADIEKLRKIIEKE